MLVFGIVTDLAHVYVFILNRFLLSGVALGPFASVANATPIVTASLSTPVAPIVLTVTPIRVNGQDIPTPSQASITGNGYTISFTGQAVTQGVVNRTQVNQHDVLVAGISNGAACSPTQTPMGLLNRVIQSETSPQIILIPIINAVRWPTHSVRSRLAPPIQNSSGHECFSRSYISPNLQSC